MERVRTAATAQLATTSSSAISGALGVLDEQCPQWRTSLALTQRRRRFALHLPWLEIRRLGTLRRCRPELLANFAERMSVRSYATHETGESFADLYRLKARAGLSGLWITAPARAAVPASSSSRTRTTSKRLKARSTPPTWFLHCGDIPTTVSSVCRLTSPRTSKPKIRTTSFRYASIRDRPKTRRPNATCWSPT